MKPGIRPNLDSIIRPDSLSNIVCNRLRDAILSNQLKPGEIYTEKELAFQFGVSRTPVREAMRVLLAQEFVISIPGRGIVINRFTDRDLEQTYELRKALEVAVVEKIANNSNKNDLNIPKNHLVEQRRAFSEGDYSKIIHFNRLFHTSLCIIAENFRMENVLNETLDIIQICAEKAVLVSTKGKIMASDRGKKVMKEHQKILDCLMKGKSTQAKKAMIEHLEQSLSAMLKVQRSKKRIGDQESEVGEMNPLKGGDD